MKLHRHLHRHLLTAALALASLRSVHALTLPVSEDTYSSATNALTKTAGAATTLDVTAKTTAFIRFDVGAFAGQIASADVTSARLIIFLPKVTKAGVLTLHNVTAEWTEAVTVNTPQPAFDAAALATIPAAMVVTKQYIIIDVSLAVKAWLTTPASDFGFALTGDATANVLLGSKEGFGAGYPASLEIEVAGGGVSGGGSLNGADLTAGSVTSAAFAPGSVATATLADGSVTTFKLAPSAVSGAKRER